MFGCLFHMIWIDTSYVFCYSLVSKSGKRCAGTETHAQSLNVGFSSPAKMSSSSGSSWSSGNSSSSGISSGGSSSAMGVSITSVLNWFAVLVLAWVVVILPNANLPLLVDRSP